MTPESLMHFPSSPLDPSDILDRPPSPVVVGCDGSHWGRAALDWAADHAWHTGAELEAWMWGKSQVPADVPRDRGLSHVTSRYPTLRVRTHESGADPMRDLETAGLTAGLVVIGYRGHSTGPLGLGGLVLPLVEAATCDTVVVRGRSSALRGDNHRITALVSGGDNDGLVLESAAAAARRHRAELQVMHAVPMPTTADALDTDHQFVLDHAAWRLDELDTRLPHVMVVVRYHPHEAITRCTDSDLVVVGSGDHHTSTGRCGTVTKAALHHAPCPVLVVRRPLSAYPVNSPQVPSARRPPDEPLA